MGGPNERWWNQPELWAEVFALLNIGFLTFDIYLAHSVNQFRNPAEYIPLLFSATSPLVLIVAPPSASVAGFSGRFGAPCRLVGHPSGVDGHDIPPRKQFLLRAHNTKPHLLGSVCSASRLYRFGISCRHESHGRSRIRRMGAVDIAVHHGRLHWQFHLQSGRPRRKRVLLRCRMGARRRECRGDWFSLRSLAHPSLAMVYRR